MKYLVFVDSDGTLKNRDGKISDHTKETIDKLQDKGIEVIVTTGRPRYHALKVKNTIDGSDYLISSNGSELYDCNLNKVIYLNPLTKEQVLKVVKIIDSHDGRYALTVDDHEYTSDEPKNEHQVQLNEDLDGFLDKHDVKQIFVRIDDEKEAIDLYLEINAVYDVKIINESTYFKDGVVERKGIWFTITNDTVNKGMAIKALCKYLRVSIDNTYGIGNDYNDIDMFKVVGHSVIMDNANDDLKSMVDIVAKSNDDDGVAHILENIFLKEE